MMGVLVSGSNFNRQYGWFKEAGYTGKKWWNWNKDEGEYQNWRFSRDGLFATCPSSPTNETLSYEGWPTTNVVFEAGMPVLWEKRPHPDGKRCLVLYGETFGKWVPDAEFRALTNRFAKNVTLPKP
jgi:hypothetical protein